MIFETNKITLFSSDQQKSFFLASDQVSLAFFLATNYEEDTYRPLATNSKDPSLIASCSILIVDKALSHNYLWLS